MVLARLFGDRTDGVSLVIWGRAELFEGVFPSRMHSERGRQRGDGVFFGTETKYLGEGSSFALLLGIVVKHFRRLLYYPSCLGRPWTAFSPDEAFNRREHLAPSVARETTTTNFYAKLFSRLYTLENVVWS